jgi:hypothetical protein
LRIEKTTRGTTKQVCVEERKTKTQEVSMEEGEGKDIGKDTHMPKASEPPEAQRKRTWVHESGSRKNAKAHMNPVETSLIEEYVELMATTVED